MPIYLAWVVKFVADMENYMNAVERVLEYTDLEHEEDPRKYPIADSTFVKGKLAFENVSLGYHLDNRVIVSGLNLTVRPGEKVRRLKILFCVRSHNSLDGDLWSKWQRQEHSGDGLDEDGEKNQR